MKKNNTLSLGITRNVLILGFVSLFTDLSSQMVFPLIPLYLTSVLGAGAFAVGIIEGSAETTASLLKVFSGYWSDKINRRKPFVLLGYSLSTITKPLFALATVWPTVLLVRIIERIGKGIRTAPKDALIAESTNRSVWGRAYGFQRAMDGMGSILGAVLAFILLPILGFKNIFLFAFIPGIIAVMIIFFIKETPLSNKKQKKSPTLKISFSTLPFNLKLFIATSFIFTLGHFGIAFMLLRAKQISDSTQTAILFYIIFYLIYTLCSTPLGMLSDKIGRKSVIGAGYLMFAILCICLYFDTTLVVLMILFAFYGIIYASIDGVQRAFVVDLSPKHLKGTALGTFHTAIGFAALPGGLIAGTLWDKIDPQATFFYAGILTLISFMMFWFVKPE